MVINPRRSFFCGYYYYSFIIIILLLINSNCNWFISKAAGEDAAGAASGAHHTVQVRSLLPPSDITCNSSPKGRRRANSLEVRHRHGPCSPVDSEKNGGATAEEVLNQDLGRVDSIRARVNKKSVAVDTVVEKAVGLPAKSGSTIGSGNYIVTLGLGTPKKDLSLIFDTGSDFTWIQCEPCLKSCYDQQEPIFNPLESSTYSNISCTSSLCSEVGSATSAAPGCLSSTCIYGIQYGDSSFSIGFFAKDTLTLGSYDSAHEFLFGCGENNQGLFGGSAGLIGLGRNKLSAVSQIASKYGSYFSYCLPSKNSSAGHLTFGKGGTYSRGIKYTPLLASSQGPSFYFIDMQGISVGGRKLPISPSVFSTAGTLIDSGTVISHLPPEAYGALQAAFSELMSKYKKAPALSILDTCYDLSSYNNVTVPKISLYFSGGVEVKLPLAGVFYVKDLSQVCLAFAGNGDANDIAILGNVQQLTFDVVYDVGGSKLGFGPAGCT